MPAIDHCVAMPDRVLIHQDVTADSCDRLEKACVGRAMGFGQLTGGDPYLSNLESDPIDAPCKVERRLEPARCDASQIRSTTCRGTSASPNAAIVRALLAGLTTFPCGLSSAQRGDRRPGICS